MALRATTTATSSSTGAILAFNPGEWFVTDDATGQDATIHVYALPDTNIDDFEYRIDGGTWTSLGGSTVGTYGITTAADKTQYLVELRSTNTDSQSWPSLPRQITTTAAGTVVTSNATLVTALNAATNGDTITLSSAWTEAAISISGYSFSTSNRVVINQQNGGTVKTSQITNCQGLEFVGVVFEHDNQGNGSIGTPSSANTANNWDTSSNIVARNCSFDCGPSEDRSNRTTAQLDERWAALRSISGTYTLDTCFFDRVRDGIGAFSNSIMAVDYTHFQYVYEDGATGSDPQIISWTYNSFTMSEGRNKRTFTYTLDSGAISAGDIFTKSVDGTEYEVLRILSAAGGSGVAEYNNYSAIPSGTFINQSQTGQISSVSMGGSNTGIHGDFFQPFKTSNNASDYEINMSHCYVYRSTAHDFTTIGQEQNVQGLLAQNDFSTNDRWYPLNVSYNIICGGQAIGLRVIGGGKTSGTQGTMNYNSVLWQPYQNGGSDLEFTVQDTTVSFNIGDNNSGGAVDDNGATGTSSVVSNVFVDGNGAGITNNFPNIWTYPQRLDYFAPESGQAVDTGSAGALTTAGAFRG